jgi:hypothetical protein
MEQRETGVSIREAGEVFATIHADEKMSAGRLVPDAIFDLLDTLSRSPRFQEMKIFNYVNQIDEEAEKQFCAMTVEIGDGTWYIAYRGTDDTIVGWKEDFNMSFKAPVPSQLQAVEYLKQTMKGKTGRIRIGGHSKGGNLAVYAAAFSSKMLQRRMIAVHNFDGPGFTKEILDNAGHQSVSDVIKTIVPQSSVIGMLLEHEEQYEVVESKQIGIFQHDMFSWQIQGKEFCYVDDISASSYRASTAVRALILSMDKEEKEQFVEALFFLLTESGAKTLSELRLKDFGLMIKKLNQGDKRNKKILLQTLKLLLVSADERTKERGQDETVINAEKQA